MRILQADIILSVVCKGGCTENIYCVKTFIRATSAEHDFINLFSLHLKYLVEMMCIKLRNID